MSILVGSTTAPYKTSPGDGATRWLDNARAIGDAVDTPITFFAALEVDARGLEPFRPLLDIFDDLMATAPLWVNYWTFGLDTFADVISGNERLIRICTGRNLIREYAMRHGHEWILFLDSDLQAPDDALSKMLELRYPVVGAQVPVYVQSGEPISHWPTLSDGVGRGDYPVREKCDVDTAGLLLVHRSVFSLVPWSYNGDAGQTDDPTFFAACDRLGWPLLVRSDVVGEHEPLSSLESRGHDLQVRR